MISLDSKSQTIQVELDENSRQKPLGEWDGETPRRFEMDDEGVGELQVEPIQNYYLKDLHDLRLISSFSSSA